MHLGDYKTQKVKLKNAHCSKGAIKTQHKLSGKYSYKECQSSCHATKSPIRKVHTVQGGLYKLEK